MFTTVYWCGVSTRLYEHVCILQYRISSYRCKDMLAQRASQFRAVQLRLLTRFKDKTPAPLTNLDTLLEGTYRQVSSFDSGEFREKKNFFLVGHLILKLNIFRCTFCTSEQTAHISWL